MLRDTVAEALAAPRADPPFDLEHGCLPRSQRLDIFKQTLATVVFPGLRQFGVDTEPGETWLNSAL